MRDFLTFLVSVGVGLALCALMGLAMLYAKNLGCGLVAAPADSLHVRDPPPEDTLFVLTSTSSGSIARTGFLSRPSPYRPAPWGEWRGLSYPSEVLTIWRGNRKTLYILGNGQIYVQGRLVATDTATANTLKEAYAP